MQAELQRRFDVSRETLDRLSAFAALIRQWSTRINLVAPKDLQRLWERHIADSFGLARHIGMAERWADLGSGGGFPIVPLAVLAGDRGAAVAFTAYESDQRKAAFLRTVSATLELGLTVRTERVEQAKPAAFDIVSCRAFASVADMLRMVRAGGLSARTLVLLKGRMVDEELTSATSIWHMRYQREAHAVAGDGYILSIEGTYRSAHGG